MNDTKRLSGRALTDEQKRFVVERLCAAWLRVAPLRLGQLLLAATRGQDLFNLEDEDLVMVVEDFVRQLDEHLPLR